MPNKDYMTLSDVLQQEGTGDIKCLDAMRSIGLSSPEVQAFPATVVSGTSYELNMPTAVPRIGFRPANAGANSQTTIYENKTIKCFYLDGRIAIDKAVATSSRRKGELMAKEQKNVMMGAFATLALSTWYRLKSEKDAFPTVAEQMGDYMTISADPDKNTDNDTNRNDNSGASCYLVIPGDDYLHYIYGNSKAFATTPIKEQEIARKTKDGKDGYMEAYVSHVSAWTGVAVESPLAVVRIKNISATHPLTDKLVAKALRLFPAAVRRLVKYAVMNGNVSYMLQESRTITPTEGTGITSMIAADPTKVMGLDILEVDSLLDDESDTSVAAAFADDYFRVKQNSIALKN